MSSLSDIANSILSQGATAPINHLNIAERLRLTQEPAGIGGVGTLLSDMSHYIGNLNQLVHTAYCIGQAITNPMMLLNVLDQIGGNLMATAVDMASKVVNCISGQITGMFNTIAGTVLNVLNSVLSFLNSIENLVDALLQVFNRLRQGGLTSFYKFMSQEDCEFMLAQMAMCMMNKLFGDKLTKLENKVTNAITEKGQKLNQALTNQLADTNSMANFVRHESFMVDKATAQLNFFMS